MLLLGIAMNMDIDLCKIFTNQLTPKASQGCYWFEIDNVYSRTHILTGRHPCQAAQIYLTLKICTSK